MECNISFRWISIGLGVEKIGEQISIVHIAILYLVVLLEVWAQECLKSLNFARFQRIVQNHHGEQKLCKIYKKPACIKSL